MSSSAPITSPSANVSFATKLDLLWKNNKPLFVALLALVVLIVFAIIFCIVYFVVIRPRQVSASTTTTAHHAEMLYQGLRAFTHI